MKPTNIVKINPIIEMTSPTLLQCKSGECGECPRGTGKLLWIPKRWNVGEIPIYKFQYNFFNKAQESEAPIKYNRKETYISFGEPPDKAWAIANPAEDTYGLVPSEMRLGNTQVLEIDVYQSASVGCWVFFRQPNPAIGNVHDALCFEYNHEKRLITFRSF